MIRTEGQLGFSLIEVLLSTVIIGILAGVSLPIYNTFAIRNDLDLTTQQLASALRRAQTYARGMKEDSAWSVRVQASTITLYKGTDFGNRADSFDEEIDMPGSIIDFDDGLTEVQFAKFTGTPNTTGDIILDSNTNESRTITINAKGMVEY